MTIEIAVEAAGLEDPRIIGEATYITSCAPRAEEVEFFLFGDPAILYPYKTDNIHIINTPSFPENLERIIRFQEQREPKKVTLLLAKTYDTKKAIDDSDLKLKGVEEICIGLTIPTIQYDEKRNIIKETKGDSSYPIFGTNILVDVGINPSISRTKEGLLKKFVDWSILGACYAKVIGLDPKISFLSFNEKASYKAVIAARKILKEKLAEEKDFVLLDRFYRGYDLQEGKGKIITTNEGNEILTTMEGASIFFSAIHNTQKTVESHHKDYGAMPVLGTDGLMVGHSKSDIAIAIMALEQCISQAIIKEELNKLTEEKFEYISA